MAEAIKPATGMHIDNLAFTVVDGAGIEIFGAAAGQLDEVPGRVAVEIQNRNGADIEIGTDSAHTVGRLLINNEAAAWDLGSDEFQGNLYVLNTVGPVQLCVTQLTQGD